jgi:hypothetical protein
MDQISKVLNQFKILDSAVIDTSSLIYLSKIDLLDETASILNLMTVQDVVKEVSLPCYLKNVEIVNFEKKKKAVDTDQQLVKTAEHLNIPVISEDKKVLMSAKKICLPYFNTLMMINFLFFKNVISEKRAEELFKSLKNVSYYSDEVWDYGRMIYQYILDLKKIF